MRTRQALGSIFASIAILVVGWQAGAVVLNPSVTTETQPADGTTGAVKAADGTYTGDSVGTRYGDVQVSVTLAGGRIADVTPLQLTSADGRSVQISNRAAPILHDEVIASQSAAVSNVGGATYTSDGYLASLQSALDQSGF